ncbi:MAG: sensor histidine kinase [Methanobacterium sp.]
MNLNNSNRLRSNLMKFSEVLSILIIIIGFLILFGWAFDISILKSPGPEFSTIKSNVALCFVLVGISLWLQQTKRISKRNIRIAQILAIMVFLIGLLSTIEHLFNFNFGIDQLLFNEAPGALSTSSPNRMAFIAAVDLTIIGLTLLILDKKIDRHVPAQYLVLLASMLSLMVILGYLYGASEFYQIYNYTAAAIYAGIGLLIISLAIIAARPQIGFMKVLTGQNYGSVFGRRILVAVIIIPIFIGWLRVLGQNLGYYDTAFGTVLLTLTTLVILALLVWNSMLNLNTIDMKRQKSDEKLKENLEELKRSNEELQSFAYITSHDLQEPLRTMGSYASLLKYRYEGQLDDDADEFINYMVSGSKRMKNMIQGLLDYSRVGTQGGEFEEFSGEEALDNALLNLESSIKECNAKVTSKNLPVLFGDKDQITRVFQNFIGNALKFRKKGVSPQINIQVKENDAEYIFSVSDNGIGLEEQYSDKIFEVFKRLHTIGEYEGAGIGLAIIKRIIDRHNGRVWVESSLGKGSTFYFTLPKL